MTWDEIKDMGSQAFRGAAEGMGRGLERFGHGGRVPYPPPAADAAAQTDDAPAELQNIMSWSEVKDVGSQAFRGAASGMGRGLSGFGKGGRVPTGLQNVMTWDEVKDVGSQAFRGAAAGMGAGLERFGHGGRVPHQLQNNMSWDEIKDVGSQAFRGAASGMGRGLEGFGKGGRVPTGIIIL